MSTAGSWPRVAARASIGNVEHYLLSVRHQCKNSATMSLNQKASAGSLALITPSLVTLDEVAQSACASRDPSATASHGMR